MPERAMQSFSFSVVSFTNAARQEAQTAQQQYAAEMAYNKAMAELDMFGEITTQEAADVLGLPVGTTSLEWQQYLAALDAASRGGGGGDGDYVSEDYNPQKLTKLRQEYRNAGAGVVPGAALGKEAGWGVTDDMRNLMGNRGVVPGALKSTYDKNTGTSYVGAYYRDSQLMPGYKKTTTGKSGGVVPK